VGVDWGQVALVVAVLIPSVVLHEVSHGVVALWLGDDTAKAAGRLNLIPIPPLDGSAVIQRVLPTSWWPLWLQLRRYSIGLILVIVFLFPGGLSAVFDPALELWRRLL
jgi:Zn-dependent protease